MTSYLSSDAFVINVPKPRHTKAGKSNDTDFIQWYILALKYLASLLILAIKIDFNCIQVLSQIKMGLFRRC